MNQNAQLILPRSARAVLALVLLTWAAVWGAPAAQAQSLRLDTGHVDVFYVAGESGGLHLALKEDVTGSNVIHPAEDVLLEVDELAWTNATASVSGIDGPSYFLPQTQDPDLLWPGLDTQDAGREGFESVTFTFTQVSGPGTVFAFETVGFGDVAAVTDSGSLALANGETLTQRHPAHRHLNWAFTQPGQYTMRVQATSEGVTSNAATYTWIVGDGGAAPQAHDTAGTDHDDDAEGERESGDATGNGSASNNTTAHGDTASGARNDGAGTARPAKGASASKEQRGKDEGKKEAGKNASLQGAAAPAQKSAAPTSARGSKTNSPAAAPEAPAEYMVLSTQEESDHSMLVLGMSVLGAGMLVLGLGVGSLTWILVGRGREGRDS